MTEERIGEAFEQQERLTVIGSKLQPGEVAPAFVLDRLNATTGVIEQEQLRDSAGQVRLLNIINSVDTPGYLARTCLTHTYRSFCTKT